MKYEGRIRMLHDQRGVAMVTVLLIGAALTVVTSTATFLTIQEFRAGSADRRSAQALSYAEAGLDRMIQKIKTTPWDDLLVSGCDGEDVVSVQGTLGVGTFTAEVDADLDPDDCSGIVPDPFEPQFIEVRSEGQTAAASRTVRQMLRVVNGGFPIGVYAYQNVLVSGGGSTVFDGISLITKGSVNQREKLAFKGFDPWLTQFDVYGDEYPNVPDTRCAPSKPMICNQTNSLPAAVHAGLDITCQANNRCSTGVQQITEHVGSPDDPSYDLACNANDGTKGTPGQSGWDGSRNGGPIASGSSCATIGAAPTSLFTVEDAERLAPDPTPDKIDYDALKAGAQDDGIYCTLDAANKVICTRADNDLKITQSEINALPEDHIVFFDFPESAPQTVAWNAQAGNCEAGRMTLVVIRNGHLDMEGNNSIAGGVLAADGNVLMGGGSAVHGTVIAKTIETKGNSTYKLDECAIKALTAPFINVTPGQWSEEDRQG